MSFALLVVAVSYGYLLYVNNSEAPPPTKEQYQEAFNKAVHWAVENEVKLLAENNAMLWKFLDSSARLTSDHRLLSLVKKYRAKHVPRNSIWRGLFEPWWGAPLAVESFSNFPAYNLYFVYGLTCDKGIGELEVIHRQLDPQFCRFSPLTSPCVTHQLMGALFHQKRMCGDTAPLPELISDLQGQIERQLILDPRVGDVYMQRVMMLMGSGARDRIKLVWLARILEAQADDGSWETFDSLFPVGGGKSFGFSYHSVAVRTHQANFHTTAQAMFVVAMAMTEKGQFF